MDRVIKNFYLRLNFKNLNDFKAYLVSNKLSLTSVKQKLKIETLWNELILKKFKKNITIDKAKLEKKLRKDIESMAKLEEFNCLEPKLEVIIIIVFLKSIVLDRLSVILPSSKI